MSKERLTERNEANTAYYFPFCFEKCNGLGASSKCDRCELIENVCEKLGECEDLEDILREKLTDEAFKVITSSKKDFSEWIDRILWTNRRCDELAREVEKYRDLEEQKLLLRLPCKVGDTVYTVCSWGIEKGVVGSVEIISGRVFVNNIHREMIGEAQNIFLTQSEAEGKLRELEVSECQN